MQDKENISVDYPLSINFKTFRQYDLKVISLEEIVFFEWLIVKRLSFNSDEFFYQNNRVSEELGIKRHKLENIKNKFSQDGLEIKLKGLNNATNYTIANMFIENFVNSYLLEPYRKATLRKLLNLDFKNEIKILAPEKNRIVSLIKSLEEIYNNMRERKIQYSNGKEFLKDTGLSYNNKTLQQLKLLKGRYKRGVIENSFICYVDHLIKGDDRTNHILNNFSSYDKANDSFPIFESRLNEFNNNYSLDNF